MWHVCSGFRPSSSVPGMSLWDKLVLVFASSFHHQLRSVVVYEQSLSGKLPVNWVDVMSLAWLQCQWQPESSQPRKYEPVIRCWYNAGPASKTLDQLYTSIVSMFCACWECTFHQTEGLISSCSELRCLSAGPTSQTPTKPQTNVMPPSILSYLPEMRVRVAAWVIVWRAFTYSHVCWV